MNDDFHIPTDDEWDFHIPTDDEWAQIVAEAMAEEWEIFVQSVFDMLAGAE